MDVKKGRRAAGRTGGGAAARGRAEHLDNWYSFLKEECCRDDGLLCFYDREKSPQVSYLCGVLAQHLLAVPEDRSGPAEAGGDLPRLEAKPRTDGPHTRYSRA